MDYELDLWGRLSAVEGAALASFQATRFDYDAARITLIASVASTWFEWLELQQRVEVARNNLAIGERTLVLVEARFRNGAASRAELARQQTSVLSLRNAVPPLEYQARQRLAALRVLTGELPFEGDTPDADIAAVSIPVISPWRRPAWSPVGQTWPPRRLGWWLPVPISSRPEQHCCHQFP